MFLISIFIWEAERNLPLSWFSKAKGKHNNKHVPQQLSGSLCSSIWSWFVCRASWIQWRSQPLGVGGKETYSDPVIIIPLSYLSCSQPYSWTGSLINEFEFEKSPYAQPFLFQQSCFTSFVLFFCTEIWWGRWWNRWGLESYEWSNVCQCDCGGNISPVFFLFFYVPISLVT